MIHNFPTSLPEFATQLFWLIILIQMVFTFYIIPKKGRANERNYEFLDRHTDDLSAQLYEANDKVTYNKRQVKKLESRINKLEAQITKNNS